MWLATGSAARHTESIQVQGPKDGERVWGRGLGRREITCSKRWGQGTVSQQNKQRAMGRDTQEKIIGLAKGHDWAKACPVGLHR